MFSFVRGKTMKIFFYVYKKESRSSEMVFIIIFCIGYPMIFCVMKAELMKRSFRKIRKFGYVSVWNKRKSNNNKIF